MEGSSLIHRSGPLNMKLLLTMSKLTFGKCISILWRVSCWCISEFLVYRSIKGGGKLLLTKSYISWPSLQEVFIEDFLKTSSHLWEQLKPLTRGTSSWLPSSRLQDWCRRLQDVFIENFLKTSAHLWEQLNPLTRGASSGLPSSRLQDRCRRPQTVLEAVRKRLQNSEINLAPV